MAAGGRMITATRPGGHFKPTTWTCSGGCFGHNTELNLFDKPSAQTLRELKQHCIRAVAGSWHGVRAAQTW
eukprot:5301159-Pyramimonas_sp.AAC.1